jgi:hypothetical protein
MPPEVQILRVTLLVLIGLAAPLVAQADVTVQERGILSISNLHVHSTSTQQIAGEKGRAESELGCQGTASLLCGKNQQIEIIRLDRGVIWKLEPRKSRYVETSFLAHEKAPSAAKQPRAAAEQLKSCPPQPTVVDISKCELSDPVSSMEMTNDVGTFAGQDAKRTIFKLVQTCKNGAKPCEVAYSFEVWLAPEDTAGLGERHEFQFRYLTLLGIDNDSGASPPEFSQYLAPYRSVMRRLSENSQQLKGFPLKTTFRLTFSGQPCGSMHPSPAATGRPSAIAGASDAATQATSSSAQHAVGWGTADALERSTGSGNAGYVAGSAAGAFTGSLVSGLFAKKPQPQPPASSNTTNSTNETAATLVEFSLETTSLSAVPVPATQFETPKQWSKVIGNTSGEAELPSCPTGSQ